MTARIPDLNGQPPYDWAGCDLTGVHLAGKNLADANLTGANLTDTVFSGVISMDGADLSGATIVRTNFSGCVLSKTIFRRPQKAFDPVAEQDSPPQFYGANLRGANFAGAKIDQAIFEDQCDLTGANFRGAHASQAAFNTSTLSGADFTGATLWKAVFTETALDGTIFDGTDLTTCEFSPDFARDPTRLTSFRGATLNYSTIQLNWDCLDLTGTTLVGLNPSVNLTYLDAQHAVLAGWDFSGYTLTNCNLTEATLTSVRFNKAHMENARLYGVQNDCELFRVLPADADFSPLFAAVSGDVGDADAVAAAFKKRSFSLSDDTKLSKLTESRWSFIDTANNITYPIFRDSEQDPIVVRSTALVTHFDGALLPNAKFGKHGDKTTVLLGAVFIGATLDGASLTDAELGPVDPDIGTGPSQFSQASMTGTDMNGADLSYAELTGTASKQGINLSNTILKMANLLDAQLAGRDENALPGMLTGAYMPGAVLTGANLFGVEASGIQFYGDPKSTLIDRSANLELTVFSGANLSGLNLDSAQLMGVDLSRATLFNATLTNAKLTPSSKKDKKSATLAYANLQGVDFRDAQLYGAILTNAAVAIGVPTNANPNQGGVYLFKLANAADIATELNAAAKWFSLTPNGDVATLKKYRTALENNDVTTITVAFLKHSIQLPKTIVIEAGGADVWRLKDNDNLLYTLWIEGDSNKNQELYASCGLPLLTGAFSQNQTELRAQAKVTLDTKDELWLLDNDSENPQNTSLGYVRFLLKLVANGSLEVYGTAIRIQRLGDDNKLTFDTETCNITKLTRANLDENSTCPNGSTLAVNDANHQTWEDCLRVRVKPPSPPTCVPTDFNWCPPDNSQLRTPASWSSLKARRP